MDLLKNSFDFFLIIYFKNSKYSEENCKFSIFLDFNWAWSPSCFNNYQKEKITSKFSKKILNDTTWKKLSYGTNDLKIKNCKSSFSSIQVIRSSTKCWRLVAKISILDYFHKYYVFSWQIFSRKSCHVTDGRLNRFFEVLSY